MAVIVIQAALVCAGGTAVLARHWRLALAGLAAQYVLGAVLAWPVAGRLYAFGLAAAGLTVCAILGLTLRNLTVLGRARARMAGRYFDDSLVRRHAFFDDFFLAAVVLACAAGAWGLSLQRLFATPPSVAFGSLWLLLAGLFSVLLASDLHHAAIGLLMVCQAATLLQARDAPEAALAGLAGALLQLTIAAAAVPVLTRHYGAANSLSWLSGPRGRRAPLSRAAPAPERARASEAERTA